MGSYKYGSQFIDFEDIEAVKDILNGEFLTQGPTVKSFEDSISEYVGANFAVAVNSATSALHIACLSLGLKQGDILWTSPISFVASSNCGLYCGAKVDFVDIHPKTFNICPSSFQLKVEEAKVTNTLPKILVIVHMCGSPADLQEIKNICDENNIKIIEDASHALGASLNEKRIGSCQYSDISVFSFHPVKMITTGEGGMATTNCQNLYKKMNLLRSHGITRNNSDLLNNDGPWYYEQQDLGFNYRLSDISASLGLAQLKKLDSFLSHRNNVANLYKAELDTDLFSFQELIESSYSSYHLFVGQLKQHSSLKKLSEFFAKMAANSIDLNVHYIPIYRHPYYRNFNYSYQQFKNAEDYYSKSFSLPIHMHINEEDIKYISKKANELALNL